jgi:hypothetical protein
MQAISLAVQAFGPAIATITQPVTCVEAVAIVLPSDGLTRARPKIALSTFFVTPGPELEALMRKAAFLGTEHKYDI